MPVYEVPRDDRPYVVVENGAGEAAVVEAALAAAGKRGAKLGGVFIPCRDRPQAEALAEKLNTGDHDGTVRVDLL